MDETLSWDNKEVDALVAGMKTKPTVKEAAAAKAAAASAEEAKEAKAAKKAVA